MNWRAATVAGVAAGVISTLVQIVLWIAFTDAFPQILWRDSRLAAAILLGTAALDESIGMHVVLPLATAVHFALSIVYGMAVAAIVHRAGIAKALVIGALFGAALFAVNLYGFTMLFPWFAVARDVITFAAHLAFGISAAAAYRGAVRRVTRSARSRSA